jgi:hypothetical protein
VQQVYSRAAAAAPPPVTPYVDRVPWTVSVAEVTWATKKVAPKTPGPGGVDTRFFKKYVEELAPLLAPVLTRALPECPELLKRGETTLLPKKPHAGLDPALYRPTTLLCVLVRVLAYTTDRRLAPVGGVSRPEGSGGLHARSQLP